MHNKQQVPAPRYPLDCSLAALRSYQLGRRNEAANLRKQVVEKMLEAMKADAEALFAEWIQDFGEAMICQGDAVSGRSLRDGPGPSRLAIAPASE